LAQQTKNNANRRSAHHLFHTSLFVIVFIKWKRKYFFTRKRHVHSEKERRLHYSIHEKTWSKKSPKTVPFHTFFVNPWRRPITTLFAFF
jgi:hypothetical protein